MKFNVSYYLKSGDNGLFRVMAKISFGYSEFDVKLNKKVYKPVLYYTPLKISKSDWDSKKSYPKSKQSISSLVDFEKQASNCFQKMILNNEEINPTTFKKAFDLMLGREVVIDKLRIRLTDFIEDEIIPSGKFSKGTIKRYRTTINNILAFEKRMGRPLYATDINEEIYKYYIDFLESNSNIEKNNSLVSYLTYFNSALSKISRKYKISLFKASRDLDSDDKRTRTIEDKVYLNFDDINKVIKFKPKTEKLKNVKLIFLTLLLTGCRYGDVFKVKPEFHYKKNNEDFYYCKFITQKNQKEVLIPILKPLMDAFEAYKGTATYMHIDEFDTLVKDLVRNAGITHEESKTYTDSKRKVKFDIKPFWAHVSSHTGRRSFITNLIKYIPITTLCKITTHELKDKSIIFIYDKTTLLENAIHFIRNIVRAKQDFQQAFPFRLF